MLGFARAASRLPGEALRSKRQGDSLLRAGRSERSSWDGSGAGRSEANSAPVERTRQAIPACNLLRSAPCISHANEEGFPEAGRG